MLKCIHESDGFIYQTLYTTFNCFYLFYMISDQFSVLMKWKREKRGTWYWCVRAPLISCPQVRRVTCTEGPLSWTALFPKQPHPEHHEDDYFHPPHPTPPCPGALGCKPNMQILPVQTGRGTDIQIMTLLLSFLSFLSLISPYAVHILQLNLAALVELLAQWPPHAPPPSSVCLSLPRFFFFFPPLPVSRLTAEGCWNITDFIRHPPTHKPTLHLVIHLVPFTLCLIKLCWPCGFFLSFFFFFFFLF